MFAQIVEELATPIISVSEDIPVTEERLNRVPASREEDKVVVTLIDFENMSGNFAGRPTKVGERLREHTMHVENEKRVVHEKVVCIAFEVFSLLLGEIGVVVSVFI